MKLSALTPLLLLARGTAKVQVNENECRFWFLADGFLYTQFHPWGIGSGIPI